MNHPVERPLPPPVSMCFHLFLASPLTLSEVRSMLPPGMAADLLTATEQSELRQRHPQGRTGVRLLRGACSCDLVVQRHPVTREDEALLRKRYRKLGLSRAATIRALENHRSRQEHPASLGEREPWPEQLSRFVAEHARNAGPSLYVLHFSHDGSLGELGDAPTRSRRAAEVRDHPGAWLVEEEPTIVHP